MPTTDTIRATVAALLTEPGPLWEADLIKRYCEHATRVTAVHVEHYKAGDKDFFKRRYDPYVKAPATINYRPWSFDQLCAFAAEGKIVADLDRATDDAKRDYQSAREAFIEHVTEKLACAFAHDADLRVHGTIRFSSMITGEIAAEETLTYGEGRRIRARFGISVQVKTNYRYGENSANRNITQYHQYPITVNFVEVDGVLISAANSIEQAALAISGRRPTSEAAAARKARVDAKTAYRNTLYAMERAKRKIDQECSSLRYNVDALKYHKGNATRIAEIVERSGFPTADALIAAHKDAAAQLKAAREAIKAHKAVKP